MVDAIRLFVGAILRLIRTRRRLLLQRGNESANRAGGDQGTEDNSGNRFALRGASEPSDELEAASHSRSAGSLCGSAVAAGHERGNVEGGVVPTDWAVASGAGLAQKKVRPIALDQRRGWISEYKELSIRQQCRLTGISRSGWYYEAKPETAENLRLMRFIDEPYTRTPFYGIRKMTWWLGEQGYAVNPKRVRRLMRQMGLEAIYRKPRLSVPGPGHRIYPYRLRGLKIDRPNQVWSSDITYIRLRQGFIYLAAVMDWFSRYVLAWEVSVSLETSFCLAALDWALPSGPPDIFNTDQGSQFSSEEFTSRLESQGIDISMDGRGRVSDNIFIERLWRTVKYAEVYLKDYIDVLEAVSNLKSYFAFYNHQRPHQALGYQTPAAMYFGKVKGA